MTYTVQFSFDINYDDTTEDTLTDEEITAYFKEAIPVILGNDHTNFALQLNSSNEHNNDKLNDENT